MTEGKDGKENVMTGTQIIMAVVMFVYLAGMVVIGVYYSKKGNSSTKDFYLGGRRLGPLVTAMSAEASDMSSYLLMGLPGLAYFSGVADVGWTIIGLAAGTYLNWLLVAKRIRVYSEEIDAITVPAFFSKRFKDDRNILACIAAIIIIIFFIPYTASGFAAVGKLFNSLFGFDYMACMLIGAAVIIIYTILGGFLAVSTTDLVQSIVMTISLLIILGFGVSLAGGTNAVIDNASQVDGYLNFFRTANVATGESGPYGFFSVISTLAWGLGYFGMPHILLRFMGTKNPKQIKVSRRIASIWVVISMAIAVHRHCGLCAFQRRIHRTVYVLICGRIGPGKDRRCTEQSRSSCSYHCRPGAFRYPGSDHVYGRFTAAGSFLQCFRGYLKRGVQV